MFYFRPGNEITAGYPARYKKRSDFHPDRKEKVRYPAEYAAGSLLTVFKSSATVTLMWCYLL